MIIHYLCRNVNELRKKFIKKHAPMLCTPKVRQTFGGAYFYERKEKNEQKILARIQNICYTVYAK